MVAAGGHDALDPLAALAFCAAVTDRLRLIPNILVLPYRNPFLVAKAGATLDALSGGRFTLAVATGYLRGEYHALGVDFDQRNALFDEAIEVILGVWTENDFAHQGTTFTAKGQTANPKPDPLPPIWIGGNSRLSRQRVARYGQGWNPFPAPRSLARTTKSTPARVPGRPAPDAATSCGSSSRRPGATRAASTSRSVPGPAATRATTASTPRRSWKPWRSWPALGVTWSGVGVPGDSLDHAIETLQRFGESVIG